MSHNILTMLRPFGFVLILLFPILVSANELEFRFIGNMAFAISDGKITLFSDFPYESGAFGYMKYDLKDIKISDGGLSLITHSHRDHWAVEIFQKLDLKLIAPPDVQKGIVPSRIVALEKDTNYEGIHVEAFTTPHGKNLTHYSYLVTWHGIRMYFTGDTEELKTLVSMRNLDVAFISPWLAQLFWMRKRIWIQRRL